jgi:tetratricopeptide (TPR) repeat protein
MVLARRPDHIGAIHFYIHVLDNSPNAVKAAPYADRIGALAPAAGHLVHMASHIYLQIGRYADAEDANVAALAADQRFLDSVPPGSEYEQFTTHPVHFLWYTLLFEGKRADAQHYSEHAGHKAMGPFAASFSASLRAITDARFGLWDDALALNADDSMPGASITSHFARGLALVAKGKLDEAAAEVAKIQAAPAIKPKLPEGMMPPPMSPDQEKREKAQGEAVAASAAGQLQAAIAMARGDRNGAIAACEAAVAAEDAMPREGEIKLLPIPARQRLGTLYLAAQRPADAERVYREDLARFPENGWSLFGLATALDAQHSAGAAATWERFRKAWARSDIKLTASVL